MSTLTRVNSALLATKAMETRYWRARRLSAFFPIRRELREVEGTESWITSSSAVESTATLIPKKDNKSSRYLVAKRMDSSLFILFYSFHDLLRFWDFLVSLAEMRVTLVPVFLFSMTSPSWILLSSLMMDLSAEISISSSSFEKMIFCWTMVITLLTR